MTRHVQIPSDIPNNSNLISWLKREVHKALWEEIKKEDSTLGEWARLADYWKEIKNGQT